MIAAKDRPNFGFGFGAESVDCSTFDITSVSAERAVILSVKFRFRRLRRRISAGTESVYIRRYKVSDCTRTRSSDTASYCHSIDATALQLNHCFSA